VTYQDIATLVSDVMETEHKYLLHGPRHDPVVTPWMPYQPADFIGILWECMPEMKGSLFIDIGCGPGTKMRIAETMFGLDVRGIEINADMADEARKHFTEPGIVCTGNALDYDGLGYIFDLIWLYRPFREAGRELLLEQRLMANMKPGAILAGASWEVDHALSGWGTIVDDCLISPDGTQKIVRGAWQKPPGAS
jgi:SAM-dependent methyltransferase